MSFGLSQGPEITGQAIQNNPLSGAPKIPQVTTNFVPKSSSSGGSVLGAAIGTLGNLIGDTINYKRQKNLYDTQRKDALEDYRMQREDYLSDLAAERAYNSPAAQKSRLLEAGINPNIAFGNGNVANTSSPAENTSNVRSSIFPSVPTGSQLGSGVISSSVEMMRGRDLQSDILLKQASVAKMLKESGLLDEQKKGLELDNISKSIANSFANSIYETDLKQKSAEIDRLHDSLLTASLERDIMLYDLNNIQPAKLAQIKQAINSAYADMMLVKQEYMFNKQIRGYRVSYHASKAAEAESAAILKSFEASIKSLDVPADGFDRYIQATLRRLKMLRESLISF